MGFFFIKIIVSAGSGHPDPALSCATVFVLFFQYNLSIKFCLLFVFVFCPHVSMLFSSIFHNSTTFCCRWLHFSEHGRNGRELFFPQVLVTEDCVSAGVNYHMAFTYKAS